MTLKEFKKLDKTFIQVNSYDEVVAVREQFNLPEDAWSYLEDSTHRVNQKDQWPIAIGIVSGSSGYGWDRLELIKNLGWDILSIEEIINPLENIILKIRKEII